MVTLGDTHHTVASLYTRKSRYCNSEHPAVVLGLKLDPASLSLCPTRIRSEMNEWLLPSHVHCSTSTRKKVSRIYALVMKCTFEKLTSDSTPLIAWIRKFAPLLRFRLYLHMYVECSETPFVV